MQSPVAGPNGPKHPSVTDTNEVGAFFPAVRPGRLLVATDFDGTLAPIRPEPGGAVILPAALDALRRLLPLAGHVAVISGRSTADLAGRLPLEGVELLGDYGLSQPATQDLRALARFREKAAQVLAGLPQASLEAKAAGASVHFREAPDLGPRLLAELEPLARELGLRVRSGRMVVEVMPQAAEKAVALERLIERHRPEGVFFAGDDTGDEGCFQLLAALPIPHLAAGVRSPEAPAEIFSACDVVLEGPEEAARLLSRLADWASRAGRDPAGP